MHINMGEQMQGTVAGVVGGVSSCYSRNPLDRLFFAGYYVPRPESGTARVALKGERIKWLQAALIGLVKEARNNPAEIWAELTMTDYDDRGPDTPLDEDGNTAMHWVLNPSLCSADLLPHRRDFLTSCEVMREVMEAGGTPTIGNAAGITPIELCQDLATLSCLCYTTKSRRPDLVHEKGSATRQAFATRFREIRRMNKGETA